MRCPREGAIKNKRAKNAAFQKQQDFREKTGEGELLREGGGATREQKKQEGQGRRVFPEGGDSQVYQVLRVSKEEEEEEAAHFTKSRHVEVKGTTDGSCEELVMRGGTQDSNRR